MDTIPSDTTADRPPPIGAQWFCHGNERATLTSASSAGVDNSLSPDDAGFQRVAFILDCGGFLIVPIDRYIVYSFVYISSLFVILVDWSSGFGKSPSKLFNNSDRSSSITMMDRMLMDGYNCHETVSSVSWDWIMKDPHRQRRIHAVGLPAAARCLWRPTGRLSLLLRSFFCPVSALILPWFCPDFALILPWFCPVFRTVIMIPLTRYAFDDAHNQSQNNQQ